MIRTSFEFINSKIRKHRARHNPNRVLFVHNWGVSIVWE